MNRKSSMVVIFLSMYCFGAYRAITDVLDPQLFLIKGILEDISKKRTDDLQEQISNIKGSEGIVIGPIGYERKYLTPRESFIKTTLNIQDKKFATVRGTEALLPALVGLPSAEEFVQLFDFLLLSNASLGEGSYARYDEGGVQHRVVEKQYPLLLESLIFYAPEVLKKQQLGTLDQFLSKPNKNLDTPLHLAVKSASPVVAVKLVTLLVGYGARLDAQDKEGRTPHALAEQLGKKELALLLQPGALEVQQRVPDEKKISKENLLPDAIFKAIEMHDSKMVKTVLELGDAVIEKVNTKGETPLITAARALIVRSSKKDEREKLSKAAQEIFALILEKTSAYKSELINHTDQREKSALVYVALAGDLPLVERLIQLGARVKEDIIDILQFSMSTNSQLYGPLVQFFKKYFSIEKEVQKKDESPTLGSIDKLAIDIIDAVRTESRDEIVSRINALKAEASTEKKELSQYGLFWSIALFYLSERIYQSEAERSLYVPLLKDFFDLGGIQLYKSDEFSGTNFLHQAVGQGYTDMVAEIIRLLSTDADLLKAYLNDQDNEGDTPLHLAATVCLDTSNVDCEHIYQLLLDAGATSSIANIKGITPAQYHQQIKRNQLVVAEIVYWSKELIDAARVCNLKEVERALSEVEKRALIIGASLSEYSDLMSRLLFLLSGCGRAPAIDLKKLIEKINFLFERSTIKFIQDEHKKTMLHYAVESGNPEIVEVIISGAKKHGDLLRDLVLAQDKDGNTVMHQVAYCIDYDKGSCSKIEKMLKDAGALYTVLNAKNLRPSDIKKNKNQLVQLEKKFIQEAQQDKVNVQRMIDIFNTLKTLADSIQFDLAVFGSDWSKALFWISQERYQTKEEESLALLLMQKLFATNSIKMIQNRSSGMTILHNAVIKESDLMVEVILEELKKNSDLLNELLKARDKNGFTALDRVRTCSNLATNAACLKIEKMLLQAGALATKETQEEQKPKDMIIDLQMQLEALAEELSKLAQELMVVN